MRIIAGTFKGKKITAHANLPVRPTTDFAKESLFNILNNDYNFDEITVLDLFAGIGSITLEFASRGSQKIVAVDQDFGCIKFLTETIEKMNLTERVTVIREDVYHFLKQNRGNAFEVVYADPPYFFEQKDYEEIIHLIRENKWLKPDGELIIEHPANISFSENPQLIQSRKYGKVCFSFFEFSVED
ncbi:MAG: 16S rRNA (guanine(966)-N(2))-methyltransferase RsmD [Weeksellaceae bacterium]